MKDIYQVFDETFAVLNTLIDREYFIGCSITLADLIRISIRSGFHDGVLVCEVLQGAFDQLAPLLERYEIDEESTKNLRERLKQQIALVAKSYRLEDKGMIYEALKNFRTVATEFQFECWNTRKEKPHPRRVMVSE